MLDHDLIAIDSAGTFPTITTTSNNKYILVAMDYFSNKWQETYAIPN